MKRILIIGDPILRGIYRRKFEMSGYQVEALDYGPKALKRLPSYSPELVLMDIILPGIEGAQVIRAIRSQPAFKTVPIIVLSSFYRPDLAKQAWEAGASKCVSKMDCTPNLVLEIVEQVFSGEATNLGVPAAMSQPGCSTIVVTTAAESERNVLPEATPTFATAPPFPAMPRPTSFLPRRHSQRRPPLRPPLRLLLQPLPRLPRRQPVVRRRFAGFRPPREKPLRSLLPHPRLSAPCSQREAGRTNPRLRHRLPLTIPTRRSGSPRRRLHFTRTFATSFSAASKQSKLVQATMAIQKFCPISLWKMKCGAIQPPLIPGTAPFPCSASP